MRRFISLALLLPMSGDAAGLSARSKTEISHLLTYVATSGCDFYRNGSWNPAAAASKHLESKYHYLANRQKILDAEQFIAKAATQSSVSGTAYQVRCEGIAAVPSAIFMTEELLRFRQHLEARP